MSLFGSNPSANTTPSKPLFGGNTSLFGSTPTTTNVATPPGSNSLFGAAAPAAASTPLFGGTKPAATGLFGSTATAPSTTSAAPATGGLFGATTTTTTSAAPTTGLFGATSTAQPAAAASSNLFGGAATATPAAPATGSLFGAPSTTTTAAPATGGLFGAPSTATSAAPTTGGLFGAKPATTTPASTLGLGLGVTPAPAGGGSLTLGTAAPTAAATTGTAATASSSGMNFTDFNGLLQRLTNEFEDLNHQFVEDVSVLNNYDQLLRDNSKTLIALNDEISKLEQSKSRCTTESDGVNAQLKDITDLVSGLEKELGITDADANLADCAKNSDANRQHIMKMFLAADAVMQHLEEDVDNLKQQVDALGKLSTVDGTAGNAESFDDIRQILVNQMEQLVYVDKQSEELGQKLLEVRGKI